MIVVMSDIKKYTSELSKNLNIPVHFLDSSIMDATKRYYASNSVSDEKEIKKAYNRAI